MPKILVVDDSGYTRKMIVDALNASGFNEIFEAASGDEALKQFDANKPDIVLLDLILIGLDGAAVLREIRKKAPSVKVIVITAIGQDAYKKETSALGVQGYITKPFEPKELIALIKKQ